MCFYIISLITTFILGIYGLTRLKDVTDFDRDDHPRPHHEDPEAEEESDPKISFNVFTYTLPFVAFVLDHSTKRLRNLGEKSIYILIKLVLIIYYLGSYVLALQTLSSITYFIVCNVNLVVFPPFTLVYGYLLRKNKLS